MTNASKKILYTASGLLIISVMLVSCAKKQAEGLVIITEAATEQGIPAPVSVPAWKFSGKSRIVSIDPAKQGGNPKVLTSGFYAACAPAVSFDGRSMVFSARKNEGDPWQIWEITLASRKSRQVTSLSGNSTDPSWLPGDRIVFSRAVENDSLKSENTLYTCNLDGTDIRRITFDPGSWTASSVLSDGRIISKSCRTFPDRGKEVLMVMRPDGTKAELFYNGPAGSRLLGKGCETGDGKIVFVEAINSQAEGGRAVSISYNRPLHSRTDLYPSGNGSFLSVFPSRGGSLLAAFRPGGTERFGLYEFTDGQNATGRLIYSNPEFDVKEAVVALVRERPKKLPSEVDMGVKTGLLLCQNINTTGMVSPENGFSLPLADRIEIIGIDSALGVVRVQKDGSFYLKVSADMPFRIKTMDKTGKVLNGPGSWIWLRPNERRGCVGCHEDQEMVPANRYALAVSHEPVAVPVHVRDLREKEVELE